MQEEPIDIITIYEKYTGKIVPENLRPQYEAWGKRALIELQQKLGWPLTDPDLVSVVGRTHGICDCDVDKSSLLPAPEKRGTYRFFSFNDKQPYVLTDPFKKINAVYLCRVEPEGEHIHTVDNEVVILADITDYTPKYIAPNFGKYIQACNKMAACQSECNKTCLNCTALLVDANWLTVDDIPDALAYILCDYIDWMADGGPESRKLKSESVDGHSVSYGEWNHYAPMSNAADVATISLYAGPYGIVDRKNIW